MKSILCFVCVLCLLLFCGCGETNLNVENFYETNITSEEKSNTKSNNSTISKETNNDSQKKNNTDSNNNKTTDEKHNNKTEQDSETSDDSSVGDSDAADEKSDEKSDDNTDNKSDNETDNKTDDKTSDEEDDIPSVVTKYDLKFEATDRENCCYDFDNNIIVLNLSENENLNFVKITYYLYINNFKSNLQTIDFEILNNNMIKDKIVVCSTYNSLYIKVLSKCTVSLKICDRNSFATKNITIKVV